MKRIESIVELQFRANHRETYWEPSFRLLMGHEGLDRVYQYTEWHLERSYKV